MTVSLNSATPVITSPEENVNFLLDFVGGLFVNAFPHLAQLQINATVQGLVCYNKDVKALKEHLREFLVQIKVCLFTCLFVYFILNFYFK